MHWQRIGNFGRTSSRRERSSGRTGEGGKNVENSSNAHDDSSAARSARENAARAAFDLGTGRVATDHEWAHARARLIEFAAILYRWQHEAAKEKGATWEPK